MVIVARASLRYLPRSIGFEYVVPGNPWIRRMSVPIALDVSTKLGPARGSVLKTDSVALTAAPQCQTVKFLAIVDVDQLGYARRRPLDIEMPLLEPLILRQTGHR